MAFNEMRPASSRVVLENNILKQVSSFKYLRYNIGSNYYKDLEESKKISSHQCGSIKIIFKIDNI